MLIIKLSQIRLVSALAFFSFTLQVQAGSDFHRKLTEESPGKTCPKHLYSPENTNRMLPKRHIIFLLSDHEVSGLHTSALALVAPEYAFDAPQNHGIAEIPRLITADVAQTAISLPVTYLHTDLMGSVIAETDSSGNLSKTATYKPFGESKFK